MIGNAHVRDIVESYIATIKKTGTIPVPFVLLVWPSWLGKLEFAQHMAASLIGEYTRQDCLSMLDCSRDIEKDHTIKISSDEEITRLDGSIYEDVGIREVNQRLVKSPAGQRKVLIIEDIERMTESAANGLLKMLEEPLPWRLILATCSHQHAILPTIFSRALICSFYPTDDKTVDTYIDSKPALQAYARDRLIALASGRPWVLDELLEYPDHLDLLQQAFDMLGKQRASKTETYKTLLAVSKAGLEKTFLQAYIYRAAQRSDRSSVRVTQAAFSLTDHTINADHILFDFVNAHYAATHA